MIPLSVVAALSGAFAALVVALCARRLGRLTGLMDHPDHLGGRKRHRVATPLVGGIGFFVVSLVSVAAGYLAGGPPFVALGIVGATFAMLLLGIMDDRHELPAGRRLMMAAVILAFPAALLPELCISFLRFGTSGTFVSLGGIGGVLFSVLCLVGFQNAVNMADGKNGYVIGQALLWGIILALRAPDLLAFLAPVIAGLLVLMGFNMRGRLFLGDSGSYAIATFFGLIAILVWNGHYARLGTDDLALVFALPVFDTLRLIVVRVLKRRTPFTPGRDHFHHILDMRWGWPRPLPLFLLLVLLPNLGAILLPGSALWWLLLTFAIYVFVIRYATTRQKWLF